MAWWEGAVRLELQPESDDQPAIKPTQVIFHSIAAPWDEQRLLEHWRTTNLESHFGVDYDGSVGQYIGTETRADANAGANLRPDGTGAVSVESASRVDSTDPWTDAQLETLTALGVWAHRRHPAIPLRICRTATDPGFGYHSLFPAWSTSGTTCPGPARIRQFREVLFPRIVARANGAEDMALTDGVLTVPPEWTQADNPQWAALSILIDQGKRVRGLETAVKGLERTALTDAQITAIADRLASSTALAEAVAARVADVLAARLTS